MQQLSNSPAGNRLRTFLQILGLGVAALACVATSAPNSHEPIYMGWKGFRASVKVGPPRAMAKRGKIYVHGSLLLVSEPNKGIHVINNSDPAAPQPKAFIRVVGNVDLAVRGDYLYADSSVDLLVFRLHDDPRQIKLVRRMQEVFPYQWRHTLPEGERTERILPRYPDKSKGVVVGWRRIERRGWL
jgi:hypothetical protein